MSIKLFPTVIVSKLLFNTANSLIIDQLCTILPSNLVFKQCRSVILIADYFIFAASIGVESKGSEITCMLV